MLIDEGTIKTLFRGMMDGIGKKITKITGQSTDNEYPSAKAVKDYTDTSIENLDTELRGYVDKKTVIADGSITANKLEPELVEKVNALPEVTVADNGDLLKVVDGIWTKQPVFKVTLSYNSSDSTLVANKTAFEIYNAYTSGKHIEIVLDYRDTYAFTSGVDFNYTLNTVYSTGGSIYIQISGTGFKPTSGPTSGGYPNITNYSAATYTSVSNSTDTSPVVFTKVEPYVFTLGAPISAAASAYAAPLLDSNNNPILAGSLSDEIKQAIETLNFKIVLKKTIAGLAEAYYYPIGKQESWALTWYNIAVAGAHIRVNTNASPMYLEAQLSSFSLYTIETYYDYHVGNMLVLKTLYGS